ncbi:MAG TPA: YCF48-related protein, partial [Thermoanaerobaculia bacterium]|nr:YCF48-related protein [Thermoanaerobaculia bacterium]
MMRFHVRLAAGALALLAAVSPLYAQEPRWTPLGPFGGTFVSLTVHPTDPRVVYAGGTAGLVKSVDGGGHWTTLALTPSGGLLALDPARPSTVYATGYSPGFLPLLFKSVDGGGRWASVTDSLPIEPFESFSALAVDPAVPSRVFLGTSGRGLWRSPDRGASWELAVQGLPDGDRTDVAALAAAPKPHSGTVYLGAGSRGLFRSVDAGGSWKRVPRLPAARVTALAIAPSDPRTIYVAFQSGVLFRSANAGASWRKLQRTPFGAEVTRLAVSPRSPGTVYAVDAGAQLFRTQNGGAQWTRLSSGLRTVDVAVAPSDARTVYAGGASTRTDLGGIARSTDAGARFRKVNEGLLGLDALSLALDPAEPETLWAGV